MGDLFDRNVHPLYALIAYISAIIVLLLLISAARNKKGIAKKHKLIFLWVIFFCIQDGTWGLFASHIIKSNTGLFLASNVFHFSAIFSAFAWTVYFLSRINIKRGYKRMYQAFSGAVALVQVGMLIANLSNNFMFYVNGNGYYQTTDYRAIMFYLQFSTYILIGIVSLIGTARERKTSKKGLAPIFFVNLSPLLFSVFQMIYPDAPADSIGFSIGCLIIELFLSNEYEEQVFTLEQMQKQLSMYKKANLSDALISLEANLSKDELYYGVWKDDNGNSVPLQDIIGMKLPCSYDKYVQTWKKEFIKEGYASFFSEKTDRENLVEKYNNGSPVVTFDYEANTISGRRTWLRRNISMIEDSSGNILAFVSVKDIYSLVEQAERDRKELADAKFAAEAANRSKTAFLFNMSHDIRTPMNAIIGYTNIAIKHRDDQARVDESLEKIQVAGSHLLNLINDILEMSRIESGKLEIAEDPVDIRTLAKGVAQMSSSLTFEKSIDFKMTIGNLENPYVYTDELHMNEVLINLISNAVKYTQEGGRVRLNVEQIGEPADGKAAYRFEVSDNGIGMSEEFQTHLFETFSREKTSTVSKQQGAGLGLSIVKKITDLAGGTIRVDSKRGEGSSFIVEIPLRVMNDEAIEKYEAENKPKGADETGFSFGNKKVLLVEDNEMNREIATDILGEAGLIIDAVEDGAFAVEAVKEKGVDFYDFILMDIQMPVMDGYEATKAIRALPGGDKVTIIALSANAFGEDIQQSLSIGMNAHVAKPIEVRSLFETLQGLSR